MNSVIQLLLNRKSIRAYEGQEISAEAKAEILQVTLRAPTAGNLMLYSIIEVTDPNIKSTLAKTCDNQPFIAKAPWVLLFLADYQRWFDYFLVSGVEQLCAQKSIPMRKPEEGDLFLACCDALIAAQTAVIAAESLGIGSCYIGDIMENYEVHKELLNLPQFVFPICLVCFGYPTPSQKERERTQRFQVKFIVFENQYKRLGREDLKEMHQERQNQVFKAGESMDGCTNIGQLTYLRKFSADFSIEMSRSVRAMLKTWQTD
jgi:FMN reductase (NADPH)/FMN reductase [NAD(P)H]